MTWAARLAVLCVALGAISANANPWHNQASSNLMSNSSLYTPNFTQYGCASVPAASVRPAAAHRVQRLLWERARAPSLWSMGVYTQTPSNSDWFVWDQDYADPLRLVVRDYAAATVKPMLYFWSRQDVYVKRPPASVGNARTVSSGGCGPDSPSWSGVNRECGLDVVPMCVGGERDRYWCPSDQGNAWCPGGGVCTPTPIDLDWVMTVPAAEHTAAVSSFRNVQMKSTPSGGSNFADGFLCDGAAVWGRTANSCGPDAQYPGAGPSRPPSLPTDSIGYALSVAQVAAGGAEWPLTRRPMYYVNPPTRSCHGGASDGAACGQLVNPTDCGAGTCDAAYDSALLVSLGFDVRNVDYQWWIAAQALEKVYVSLKAAGASDATVQSWPVALSGQQNKDFWWTYYNRQQYPDDELTCPGSFDRYCDENTSTFANLGTGNCPATTGRVCVLTDSSSCTSLVTDTTGARCYYTGTAWAAVTTGNPAYRECATSAQCTGGGTCIDNPIGNANMTGGPVDARLPWVCQSSGGSLHRTQYGPYEYETASSATVLKTIQQSLDGALCSGDSQSPWRECATSADCIGGTCLAARDSYFSDVSFTEQFGYRGKNDQISTVPLRRHKRFLGGRLGILTHVAEPFATEGGDACNNEVAAANAGSTYTVPVLGSVRLGGSCEGPHDVTPAWSITAGTATGCAFVDPFDLTTAATADPQASLKGCTVAGALTVQLACDSALSTATVTVAAAACGDGVVNGSEECDDGNVTPDDGCSATCEIEIASGYPGAADPLGHEHPECLSVYGFSPAAIEAATCPDNTPSAGTTIQGCTMPSNITFGGSNITLNCVKWDSPSPPKAAYCSGTCQNIQILRTTMTGNQTPSAAGTATVFLNLSSSYGGAGPHSMLIDKSIIKANRVGVLLGGGKFDKDSASIETGYAFVMRNSIIREPQYWSDANPSLNDHAELIALVETADGVLFENNLFYCQDGDTCNTGNVLAQPSNGGLIQNADFRENHFVSDATGYTNTFDTDKTVSGNCVAPIQFLDNSIDLPGGASGVWNQTGCPGISSRASSSCTGNTLNGAPHSC